MNIKELRELTKKLSNNSTFYAQELMAERFEFFKTEGFEAFFGSLQDNKVVELSALQSIVTSKGAEKEAVTNFLSNLLKAASVIGKEYADLCDILEGKMSVSAVKVQSSDDEIESLKKTIKEKDAMLDKQFESLEASCAQINLLQGERERLEERLEKQARAPRAVDITEPRRTVVIKAQVDRFGLRTS